MKILHFSAMGGFTGAGGAAVRIHEGLLARGINSRFCVAYPTVEVPASFTPGISLAGRAVRKMTRIVDDRLLRRAPNGHQYLRSTGTCGFDIGRIVRQERPDIIQLHLIALNAFRLTSLSGIKIPVVWRFPDQWAFCGLAHYEPDVEKYASVPARTGVLRPLTDLSEHVRYKKFVTYRTLQQLVVVCPSRWLAGEAKRSALMRERRIEIIPTSCDTTVFAPKDRSACRAALGLPQDHAIVLTGAGSLELKSKGVALFLEAMKRLNASMDLKILALTFGKDALDTADDSLSIRHLGHVTDRRLLSIVYNAADVFAAPSRMDNLPNTVLESLACGTPVVAFDIGGMSDAIDHRINGVLVPAFNTDAFAEGIRWTLQQDRSQAVRAACRDKSLKCFSREQETDRFVSLYQKLLAEC